MLVHKYEIVVGFWKRGHYKGKGTQITSDCCITILFRNIKLRDWKGVAGSVRDKWPDLKGTRMVLLRKNKID